MYIICSTFIVHPSRVSISLKKICSFSRLEAFNDFWAQHHKILSWTFEWTIELSLDNFFLHFLLSVLNGGYSYLIIWRCLNLILLERFFCFTQRSLCPFSQETEVILPWIWWNCTHADVMRWEADGLTGFIRPSLELKSYLMTPGSNVTSCCSQ